MATVNSSRATEASVRDLGKGLTALLLCGHAGPEEHYLDLGVGQVRIFTAPNPCEQKPSQDALAVINISSTQAVFVLADGAGGLRSGGKAAQIAVETLANCVTQAVNDKRSIQEGILNGFENANRKVRALGIGAATTLAVAEINGTKVRPYHVGNSSIMLVGQRGSLKHQSLPHSPVGYAIASGLIKEEDARSEMEANLVSNMIGDEMMHIEFGPATDIPAKGTVLLCCDGLTDNLSTREIIKIVRSGPQEECMRQLSNVCLRRMREIDRARISFPDDLSVLMFRLP